MRRTETLNKLITLARIARRHVETLAYVEDMPPNLAGYCGIGSKYLEVLANKENIFPEFITGVFQKYNRILDIYQIQSGHSWLEYSGYIIDITATQFKHVISKVDRDFGKKVYICRTTNPHYYKQFVGEEAIQTAQTWYEEDFLELCQKIDRISSRAA
jgi:hypothetical protein